jgi:hypothetical protein
MHRALHRRSLGGLLVLPARLMAKFEAGDPSPGQRQPKAVPKGRERKRAPLTRAGVAEDLSCRAGGLSTSPENSSCP